MKHFTTFLIAGMVTLSAAAQNLVPNTSFEDHLDSPCSWMVNSDDFSSIMQNWVMPSGGSPDVFSALVDETCYASCYSTHSDAKGNQAPRTGDYMVGISTFGSGCGFLPDYREYVQVQLSSTLNVGELYYAEMYISLGDYTITATNNMGMYFSTEPISSSVCSQFNVVPQILDSEVITDETGWVKISGTFIAESNFGYITIGNFSDNSSTSTITVEGNYNNSYYYIDDVTVSLATNISSSSATDFVSFFPNPSSDRVTINSTLGGLSEVTLYDLSSRKILQYNFINSVNLDISNLEKGIYVYEVKNGSNGYSKGRLIKE